MRRILIIEDDPQQGPLLMRRLREEGFVCSMSVTLADGLAFCQQEEFDCIVLDLGLPDEDLKDEFDTIARIQDLRWPVVVLTGSGNPDVIQAVRKTGASVVIKPGTELLVEKIWSQINYQRGDHESAVGQQNAQRKLSKEGWWTNTAAIVSLSIAILTAAITGGAGLYRIISNEAKDAENMRQHLLTVDRRLDEFDKANGQHAADLRILQGQAQSSQDDRAALRSMLASVIETQHELKADVVRRLERIEDKLDRKTQ